MTQTPHDYHSSLADVEQRAASPVLYQQQSQRGVVAESELELAAFEKGRIAGEMEAARRFEREGGHKTFNNNTTIINQAAPTANIVEIEHLTWTQKLAALFGELCSIAYIVIMAYWVDQYRGGVGWSNSMGSNDRGQFNVHVIASFCGLWFASQAYVTYRILPLRTSTTMNKIWFLACQVLALASFGITIAAAVLAQPSSNNSWSMHAWTAYLAVAVYAAHAIYSSLKVILTPHGIDAHEWNEQSDVASMPDAHNAHMTAEQRRDHANQLPTLYRAAPTLMRHRASGAENYNADGSAPTWSEQPTYTANNFFLVPRAKWAVASLIGLVAVILTGLGEWQQLLASGKEQWAQDGGADASPLNYTGTESRLISVIGLLTLAGVMSLAYAAMPPRTLVVKGTTAGVAVPMHQHRSSISNAATQPNTQMEAEREYAVV